MTKIKNTPGKISFPEIDKDFAKCDPFTSDRKLWLTIKDRWENLSKNGILMESLFKETHASILCGVFVSELEMSSFSGLPCIMIEKEAFYLPLDLLMWMDYTKFLEKLMIKEKHEDYDGDCLTVFCAEMASDSHKLKALTYLNVKIAQLISERDFNNLDPDTQATLYAQS